MKKLLREMHDRSIWQVLGIYLAGSWVALQVVNEIGDAVGLPEWVSAGAVVLLVIGFPIIIATTLIQHRAGPPLPARAEDTAAGGPATAGGDAGSTPGPAAGAASAAPSPGGRHRRLFTWRNAILGGVGAFALLGLGTGVWMGLRAAGIGPAGTLVSTGALAERALVVLADFDGDDPSLAEAATEALRVDLSQSSVIRLADPGIIEEALERMGRDPSAPLTAEIAAELAVREGAGALIAGEINQAGTGHVFSASVLSPGDQSVLAAERETAADDSEVIPAIDRLSRKLRARIGDSYRDIRGDPPLERVTTSSLEALKLYSRAAEGDGNRAALLEEAVAIDSGFAMAWRALGILYRNRGGERARMIRALTRAHEERDRLTDLERHKAASLYYITVEQDIPRARTELEAILAIDPNDVGSMINLGVLASSVGEHERSVEYTARARAIDPEMTNGYWNGVTGLINTGRIEEAASLRDSAEAQFGQGNFGLDLMVATARGRIRDFEERIRGDIAEFAPPPEARAWIARNLAALSAASGRVRAAEEEVRIRTAWLLDAGEAAEFLEMIILGAWTDLGVRDRPDLALARLETALERVPLEQLDPLDRPYLELADVYAHAGEPARVRALLEERETSVDVGLLGEGERQQLRQVEAAIALAEGRAEEAIERYRQSTARFCHICALPGLARAYEAAGQRDSAIVAHQRYVETPYSDRFLVYTYRQGPLIGPTYERLGQLYDEAGNPDEAARFYAAFVELWEDADEELRPRVEVARERLEEILEARG